MLAQARGVDRELAPPPLGVAHRAQHAGGVVGLGPPQGLVGALAGQPRGVGLAAQPRGLVPVHRRGGLVPGLAVRGLVALAVVRQPLAAGGGLAPGRDVVDPRRQPGDVPALAVELAERDLEVVDRPHRAQDVVEDRAVGRRQQPLEQRPEVAGAGDDLAVGLGHAPEAHRLVVRGLDREQAARHLLAVAGERREDVEGAELAAQGVAIERPRLVIDEHDLGQRPRHDEPPAADPGVHGGGLGADAQGQVAVALGHQLDRRVRDRAAGVAHAALEVVAQDDPLQRAPVVAPAAEASGGVELELAAGQHEVDGVEDGGLARAVVAEQEQVPAVADLDRLVDEVVEVDEPDGPQTVVDHGSPSAVSGPNTRVSAAGPRRRRS